MFRRMSIALAVMLLAVFAQTGSIPSARAADAAPAPSPETAAAQELLSKMTGHWVLSGVIAGRNTVHDVDAVGVLQGNYVRLTETSREKDEAGRPRYEAIIFIGWARDHYICFWLDNTEVASGEIACSAAPAGNSIPLEFRDTKGVLSFTNTFAYDRAADTWQWRMANVQDGKATPFGDVTLRRQ